jgi:hypothetical protein
VYRRYRIVLVHQLFASFKLAFVRVVEGMGMQFRRIYGKRAQGELQRDIHSGIMCGIARKFEQRIESTKKSKP